MAMRGNGSAGADAPRRHAQVDLWDLAQRATILCSGSAPVELVEATATLQDLGCRLAGSDSTAELRRTWLREHSQGIGRGIRLSPNGPLLVTNVARFTSWLGEVLAANPVMALCRCGAPSSKPYCDGSHSTIGFEVCIGSTRPVVPDRRDSRTAGEPGQRLRSTAVSGSTRSSAPPLPAVFSRQTKPFVAPAVVVHRRE